MYLPLGQIHRTALAIHVRTAGDPAALRATSPSRSRRDSIPTCRSPTSAR